MWWVRRVSSGHCDLHKNCRAIISIKWKQFVDVKQSKANRSGKKRVKKQLNQSGLCNEKYVRQATNDRCNRLTLFTSRCSDIYRASISCRSISLSRSPSRSVARSIRAREMCANWDDFRQRLNYWNDFRQINWHAHNNQQINALPINHSRLLFVYFTFDFDFMWCMPKR